MLRRLFFYSCLFSCSALTLGLPTFAATPPMPKTDAMQITKPIYEWKTESDSDKKTHAFNHCLVKNMYDNGTLMMLAENNEGTKRLALQFPQNKMTPEEHFDLTIQVDKRDLFPVEAVAVSPQILTIGIPEALPDQMRKGQALYLRGPNDEVIYQLDGMEGAIEALRDCVSTNKYQKSTVDVAQDETKSSAAIAKDMTTKDEAKKPDVKADAKIDIKPETKDDATAAQSQTKDSAADTAAINKDLDILKKSAEPKPAEVKTAEAKPADVKPAETKPVEAKATAPVKPADSKPVEAKAPAAPVVAPAPAATPTDTIKNNIKELANKLEPEKKIETYNPLLPERLSAIFARTNLSPDKLISEPDATSGKPLDYAWLKDSLFLGIKEQPSVPAAGLPEAATYYLKLMKQRCGGPYVAEAALPTSVKDKGLTWLVAETACSASAKGDTIAALLFTTDKDRMTVYIAEVPAKKGADAIKARDAILAAVLK